MSSTLERLALFDAGGRLGVATAVVGVWPAARALVLGAHGWRTAREAPMKAEACIPVVLSSTLTHKQPPCSLAVAVPRLTNASVCSTVGETGCWVLSDRCRCQLGISRPHPLERAGSTNQYRHHRSQCCGPTADAGCSIDSAARLPAPGCLAGKPGMCVEPHPVCTALTSSPRRVCPLASPAAPRTAGHLGPQRRALHPCRRPWWWARQPMPPPSRRVRPIAVAPSAGRMQRGRIRLFRCTLHSLGYPGSAGAAVPP